jgi:hypothetical protein
MNTVKTSLAARQDDMHRYAKMVKKIIAIVVAIEVLWLATDMLASFSLRNTQLFHTATVIWHWVHFPSSYVRMDAIRPHAFGMNFDPSLSIRVIIFFGTWFLCVAQMILVVSGLLFCCSYVKKITAK